jgi:hypothetical protein
MFKRLLLLGLVSGILAGVAAIIYQKVYFKANEADFSKVVSLGTILIVCIVAGLLASIAYGLLTKWLPRAGEIIFNFLMVIVTFASIVGPIGYILPLDYEQPELFPGLTVPMHFFPALAWFTLKPLFIKK